MRDVASKDAIFVVGMHRSGTSALARLLSLAGAALPRDLMQSGPHNTEGHWEPLPVAQLNDHLLGTLDMRWHTPFGPGRDRAGKLRLQRYGSEARAILREQYGDRPLIVLKEPRATLLADFWIAALARLRYRVLVIVMGRNPDEVAASLAARDGFARNHGLLLWASYMAQADILTRSNTRLFCSYDELLVDPHKMLERIKREFGGRFGGRAAASAEIDASIRSDLRHHRIEANAKREPWLKPVWKLESRLKALAAGRAVQGDASVDAMVWLNSLRQIFGPILKEKDKALETERARLVGVDVKIQALLNDVRGVGQRSEEDVASPQGMCQFVPARYLALNPDVMRSGMDPWDHFERFGRREGREF